MSDLFDFDCDCSNCGASLNIVSSLVLRHRGDVDGVPTARGFVRCDKCGTDLQVDEATITKYRVKLAPPKCDECRGAGQAESSMDCRYCFGTGRK